MTFKGRTVFITGASRGIGKAIALKFAKEGANIAVIGKTVDPHPNLPGTIGETAKEIEALGGYALPLKADVRSDEEIADAVNKTAAAFGGIDILINNASAIHPFPTTETPMKRFDLMMDCNTRAVFLCSQTCYPYLCKSTNPHILNLSPPLSLDPKWFKPHVAYTISKYGMSLCTLGMSQEFAEKGIAVNSLWPKTTIGTSAIATFFPDLYKRSRSPDIVADASLYILKRDSKLFTGHFCIDEEVLKEEGIQDFSLYAIDSKASLQTDLFLD